MGCVNSPQEERLEALRNVQNAVPVLNAGGLSVPECGPGPWLQIAILDSGGSSTECPSPWVLDEDRCRQMDTAAGCAVATFPTGVEYGKVCGQIIGFASGDPESFNSGNAATETDSIRLIDGVTIPTHHQYSIFGPSQPQKQLQLAVSLPAPATLQCLQTLVLWISRVLRY